MIVVVGYLSIDPAKRDEAIAILSAGAAATREEPGNVEYRFSPDLTDADRFNVAEVWEDDDAMTAHLSTPAFATFMETLGPCLGGPVDIVRYDVSGSSKLF